MQAPQSNLHGYCQWFLAHHVLVLGGRQRIDLVNNQAAGNLQQAPQSSFQVLFRNDSIRELARKLIYEAFGRYLVIDPTNLGQFHLRLSPRAPVDSIEERGLHQGAVEFHGAAMPIDQASDGVKAFVGMVVEILTGDPDVLLIDEPEAFFTSIVSIFTG